MEHVKRVPLRVEDVCFYPKLVLSGLFYSVHVIQLYAMDGNMDKGKIIILHHESVCLKDNPLNDNSIRKIHIYIPPGYDASVNEFPVTFLLAGFTGNGITLLNKEPFQETLDERFNRLIAKRTIRPMVIVMPDCLTYYGGSQYLDSDAIGYYETYIIDELVPYIKSKLKVTHDYSKWSVVGKSSGGYGAIRLAMRHSDVFRNAACHSGDICFEYCYMPDFPRAMIEIEKCGGIIAFMQQFYEKQKHNESDLLTLEILAASAAYSPNKTILPHFFETPFDLKTGEINKVIWKKWMAQDPIYLMENYVSSLKKLNIFIDCGIFDEYRLYVGSRIFSAKLKNFDVKHVYEEFNDTHVKISYRYDKSLQFISDSMG